MADDKVSASQGMTTSEERRKERREQWKRLESRWRNRLEEIDRTRALEVNTVDDLKNVLGDMLSNYDGIEKEHWLLKISPALDHLRSFTNAITSASQYTPVSCLVWGGIQAFMESADQYRQMSQDVVDLVVELDNSIPSLERYADLPNFGYTLQDLFEDFMDYCVQVSIYYSRPWPVNLVRNLIPPFTTSKPHQLIEDRRKRIRKRLQRFRDTTIDIDRRFQQNLETEIAGVLPAGLTDEPAEVSNVDVGETVEFPMNTVSKALTSAFVGRDDTLEAIEVNLKKMKFMNRTSSSGLGRSTRWSSFTQPTPSGIRQYGQSPETDKEIQSTEKLQHRPGNGAGGATVSSTQDEIRHSQDAASRLYIPATCVLHGLGGVGKTQIAVAYYFDHRDEYDAVFWLEAEHEWTLADSFAHIAVNLGLIDIKSMEKGSDQIQSQAIEKSRAWLQKTTRRWLLIFDNVEDTDDLERFMPSESRCNSSIIVTTQAPITPPWVENLGIVPVKELDQASAADCIFRYMSRDPRSSDEFELACALADHVGKLPLAMATIGGYISQSQMDLGEFFEDIKKSAEVFRAAHRVKGLKGYSKSLESVFNKAFAALKHEDGKNMPARDLLNILAFLDPDEIPEAIFNKGIEDGLLPTIPTKQVLHNCYFELRSRQLIQRDTSSKHPFISIHRTVQWNVLLDLSDDDANRWSIFNQAFALVKGMLPKPSPLTIPESDMWPPYAKYGRQILELRTHCLWPEPPVDLPMDFAHILNDMGTYMWHSGKFNEGEKALKTAEHIVDDNDAPFNHPLRANIYAVLGIITSFDGVSERENSFELRNKAYKARMEGLGQKPKKNRTEEEENLLWIVRSDMAFGWIQEENFDEVTRIMEECLVQYKRWDEDENNIPYEYAKYYQLISFCKMAKRKSLEAIKDITRCYELMTAAAGEGHSMSQLIKFCEANLLWHAHASFRPKALEINKAVLNHRKRLLGEFNHFTLESYSTCGKLCEEADELDDARRYLSNCLQRRKRAAWNEEGVARAQFRYAKVLRKLARRAEKEGKEEDVTKELDEDAERYELIVRKTIARFTEEYGKYLSKTEEQEEILDQMVSFWAGRYTGKLKQPNIDDIMRRLNEPELIE